MGGQKGTMVLAATTHGHAIGSNGSNSSGRHQFLGMSTGIAPLFPAMDWMLRRWPSAVVEAITRFFGGQTRSRWSIARARA